MLPKLKAVCMGGRGQAPPWLPSGASTEGSPMFPDRAALGPLWLSGPTGVTSSSLQAPFLLARVTLWISVFTTDFRPSQMAFGQFHSFRNRSFWSPSPPPDPVHPHSSWPASLAHHPKEKSLGLVQQGPCLLTSGVCWHCDWWSSP